MPLILKDYQAEPKNGAVTVEVLRAHLVEERGIPERRTVEHAPDPGDGLGLPQGCDQSSPELSKGRARSKPPAPSGQHPTLIGIPDNKLARRLAGLANVARKQAFQLALLEGPSGARLSDRHAFRFEPERYPARWLFQGRYRFGKHFYPRPGELDPDLAAEETACAIEIDRLDAVRFWVRNLERQPLTSFWLPTSTDRFYPDFVLRLNDERLLSVE